MTTKIQNKPVNKLDIKAIIDSAPKEPEPRTLAEIHAEVGFPFAARKVISTKSIDVENLPPGDYHFFMICPYHSNGYIYETEEGCVNCNCKAWVLLGHK